MIRYGFQRLVLLGSAGYRRAELPLDDAVSLIAPNNTGKTSLINALQFLLIIDQRRMDFGSHDWLKTRRFYFPDNNAYILLEVTLPQSGTVVLGCVGKGVSHEYEYFTYQGELNVDDFRDDNGNLVPQPRLFNHLAGKGRTLYRYDATEFARLIYGGRLGRRSGEPDFTVFKMEHVSDARVFQQVLTRTLRLDKLTSANVKDYLLKIFHRDLPDASIDFKQEWDKAFQEVNAERAQYLAAERQLARIRQLEQTHDARLVLRGKIADWRERVNEGLSRWQQHYQHQQHQLATQAEELREQQRRQTEVDRQNVETRINIRGQLTRLQQEDAQQQELQQRFALIDERQQLEVQLNAIRHELEQVSALLLQAKRRAPRLIEQDLQRLQQELNDLTRQQAHLDSNFYLHLAASLSANELDRLNRVLSSQVMTLGPDAYDLDMAQLRSALSTTPDNRLALAGLNLVLDELTPRHHQLTAAQLDEQLHDAKRQISDLQQQLETARSLEQTQQRKQRLEQEWRQLEQELTDFDLLQQLLQLAPTRQSQQQQLQTELTRIEHELTHAQELADKLRAQLEVLGEQRRTLESSHQTIDRLRNNRADTAEEFGYLPEQPHHPWLGENDWPLEMLAARLQEYQEDCRQLTRYSNELGSGLNELHSAGLTKYQYCDSQDAELKCIIDFSHQLPQEREALEKKARSAVVNVTASLRELRGGLWAFQGKMREFNRLIGHRRLSDLNTFRIEAKDETQLVEAIDTLIGKAEQVNTGDSFDLFNQASVLDDQPLDEAKQILIDEGNARQGLKVADLFRLVFVVGKMDQAPESFEDIDSAASNGTVLMAKLVTGLAMLHLMQDKRHQLHAICYLDEALALDGRNQASLIATAHEFGFALIFASPAPLATARYCVPIHHHQGANHISRDSWQILEPLDTTAGAIS